MTCNSPDFGQIVGKHLDTADRGPFDLVEWPLWGTLPTLWNAHCCRLSARWGDFYSSLVSLPLDARYSSFWRASRSRRFCSARSR